VTQCPKNFTEMGFCPLISFKEHLKLIRITQLLWQSVAKFRENRFRDARKKLIGRKKLDIKYSLIVVLCYTEATIIWNDSRVLCSSRVSCFYMMFLRSVFVLYVRHHIACDKEEIMTKQTRDDPQVYDGFVYYAVSGGIHACVCVCVCVCQLMDS